MFRALLPTRSASATQPLTMNHRRRYRSGTRWGLWLWTDIILAGDLYLRRLHLVKTPWCSIFLHWIYRPDRQRHLHDHPVPFLIFILRGSYIEERPTRLNPELGPTSLCRRRWFNVLRTNSRHRIVAVHGGSRDPSGPVLTLCFAGPPRRDRPWGFHTEDGFVPWTEYDDVGEKA